MKPNKNPHTDRFAAVLLALFLVLGALLTYYNLLRLEGGSLKFWGMVVLCIILGLRCIWFAMTGR